MSFNAITTTLPTFTGCTLLETINFSNNMIPGGIPTMWEKLNVITLRLQYNQLSRPMSSLSLIVPLQSIWLHNNLISNPPGMDGGALIASICPNNIIDLTIDYNLITGGWQSGLLAQTKSFKTFSYEYSTHTHTHTWCNASITRCSHQLCLLFSPSSFLSLSLPPLFPACLTIIFVPFQRTCGILPFKVGTSLIITSPVRYHRIHL